MATRPLDPGLYLVATPIGNLRDITLRALDTLAGVDQILCEDTRTTRRLLDAHGIRARRLDAFHEHNEDGRAAQVLAALEEGRAIALVSDAGTPTISDPGFKLVRAAAHVGYRIVPVPGPSAALSALIMSGLPTDRFLFAGFAPAKSGARRTWYGSLRDVAATLIAYETGPRLAASLTDAADMLGDRPVLVARELTKLYEEARRGTLTSLAAAYSEEAAPRGEIVLVIGGPPEANAPDEASLDKALLSALELGGVKEAAALVAASTGVSKREAYARALVLREAAR